MSVRMSRAAWPALMILIVVAAVVLPARGESPLLGKTRAEAIAAQERLDSYLTKGGGVEYAARWKKYLAWDVLDHELAKPEPDSFELGKVLAIYHFNKPGLELPQFTDLREALRQYQVLSADANNIDPVAELQLLRARCQESPTRDNLWALGRVIGRLEATGQINSHAAEELRRPWSHPNAYVFVSRDVANHFVTREVKEKEYVSTNIAGAQTTGWVNADCVLTVETRPNPSQAILDLKLSGTSSSPQSISHRGRVTVYGSNAATLQGRASIIMSFDGISLGQTSASANLHAQIREVDMGGPVLERLAMRAAENKLPEAEQAGSREIENRIRKKLEEQATTLIEQANQTFADKVRKPLTRLGSVSSWQGSTDKNGIQFATAATDGFQLAAPQTPPTWKDGLDFALCVHDSALENSVEAILAGREISDRQWLQVIEMVTGRAPRAVWVHSRTDRWSTVMATERPLELHFHDECMTVAFNIDEVTRAEQKHRVNARVEATFRPNIMPDGMTLHRQGDVVVDIQSENMSSETAEELRTFLHQKFGGVLQKDVYFDALAPPAGPFGTKMRQIRLEAVHLTDGWGRVGYKLYDAPAETPTVKVPTQKTPAEKNPTVKAPAAKGPIETAAKSAKTTK